MKQVIFLKVYRGKRLQATRQFVSDQISIGSGAEGPSLILSDPSVNYWHALIERRSHGFVIADLGSPTGTFVNSKQVLESKLKHGDKITLGDFQLHFYIGMPFVKQGVQAKSAAVEQEDTPAEELPRQREDTPSPSSSKTIEPVRADDSVTVVSPVSESIEPVGVESSSESIVKEAPISVKPIEPVQLEPSSSESMKEDSVPVQPVKPAEPVSSIPVKEDSVSVKSTEPTESAKPLQPASLSGSMKQKTGIPPLEPVQKAESRVEEPVIQPLKHKEIIHPINKESERGAFVSDKQPAAFGVDNVKDIAGDILPVSGRKKPAGTYAPASAVKNLDQQLAAGIRPGNRGIACMERAYSGSASF